MVDFKVLVKVANLHEQDTLRTLGKQVEGNEEAFLDVDPKWVAQQDFITAVPIEIALTMQVREAIISQNENCRFIVTGIPTNRVKFLVDQYGYQVFHTEVTPEPEPEKKEAVPVPEEKQQEVRQNYYINGKAVSAEEFNEKANKVLQNFKKFYEEFFA